jgi:UDP-glucose:(heptosyl)LPS alpha-1,3-glucosyltransferase
MTQLKVALLKSSFRLSGGLEKYCLRLAHALRKDNAAVDILSTQSSPEHGVVSICSSLKPSFLNMLWFDFQCRRYLAKHHYDIVFGFDRHFLPLTLYRAGNGCHKAYLERRIRHSGLLKRLLLYCNPLHLLTNLSERYTFEIRPPKHIICNSHMVRDEILTFYPKVPRESLSVIHNGVEWNEFAPHFAARTKSSVPQILFIGHEWNRKGLKSLLQALACLKDLPFFLTAIGRERRPRPFLKQVQHLGLQDRVCLIPKHTTVLPYLASSSIAVIPSLYDPFANVTVEALAMGLFVITTTANGGSEVIQHGLNGFVLDEQCSAEALSIAIRKALTIVKEPFSADRIRNSVKELDFQESLLGYLRLFPGSS